MNFFSQFFGSGPLNTLPGPIPSRLTERGLADVLRHRTEGNHHIARSDYSSAATSYTNALASLVSPPATAEGQPASPPPSIPSPDKKFLDDPKQLYALLLANRSLAFRKMRRWEEAERDAEGCIESFPTWPKSHLRLAELQLDLRRHRAALSSLLRALDLCRTTEPGAGGEERIKERMGFATAMVEGEDAGLAVWQVMAGRDVCLPTTFNLIQNAINAFARSMQNCAYLVADLASRECLVVDPCWDAEGIAKSAEAAGWKVVGVVVTHAHFDHVGGTPPPPFDRYRVQVSGLHALLRKYPHIKFHMHPADIPLLLQSNSDIPLPRHCATQDGSVLTLPIPTESPRVAPSPRNVEVRFIHTPGHTAGSQCVAVRSLTRPSLPPRLLTGDTLFIGTCGRTDTPEGDVRAMHESLTKKLAALGDECFVFPGHSYGGEWTTIGKERREGVLEVTWAQFCGMTANA
ncbi:Metallo-hydrolase/oxidoreductase [Gonapodya prolifera JEL478]|uniref:Metallo-hydrolase/oxidoreductase n=1 Tax=Gonapodya prolifera (strain JEL478) TaxID=1344416 RepID=A0A139AUI8_GONPJ|nr:Metallo-hydrolase/oxidoreductase [Gonapodya prolifera JEL478]|eukprot:KXS20392.1 Metallo-hydrolase/oxidoreductase [Gonapodya prolifera JEL478]